MKKITLFLILIFSLSNINAQNTIQEIIDNADSYDTITIDSGTYSEALIIDKSITLNTNGEVILNVAGHTTGITVNENTSDVTISGFTIIGDALTGSGITVNPGATNISLNNNTITNILLPGGGNSSPLSYGILCWGDTDPVNPPSNITIDNNNISNVLGSAISLGSNTSNVTISNNTFSDIFAVNIGQTEDASIGIQAELSSSLTINNNSYNDLTISNNLINCNSTSIEYNTYYNSSLMLLTSFLTKSLSMMDHGGHQLYQVIL